MAHRYTQLHTVAAIFGVPLEQVDEFIEHADRAAQAIPPAMAALHRQTRHRLARQRAGPGQAGVQRTRLRLGARAESARRREGRQRAAQQSEETSMARMNPGGRISKADLEWHAARAREQYPPAKAEEIIAAWRLLTDDPDDDPRLRAARGDDGGVDEEFAHLWPPGQLLAEAEERDKIAAAAGAKARRRGKAAAAQAAREAVAGRQRIAAAAAARAAQDELDDDEMFARLWPEGQYEP